MAYGGKRDVIVPGYGIAGVYYGVESRLWIPTEYYRAADGRIDFDIKVPSLAIFDRKHWIVGTRIGNLVPLTIAIAVTTPAFVGLDYLLLDWFYFSFLATQCEDKQ